MPKRNEPLAHVEASPLAEQGDTRPIVVTRDDVDALHKNLVDHLNTELCTQQAQGEVDPALRRDVIQYLKNINAGVATTTSMKKVNTDDAIERFKAFKAAQDGH